jgi:hypothetical protein
MKKAIGKIDRAIIDDFRFLIREQITIATMSGDETCAIFFLIAHLFHARCICQYTITCAGRYLIFPPCSVPD